MNRISMFNRISIWVLSGSLFIFSITGCSAWNRLANWMPLTPEQKNKLSANAELSRFCSSIRPLNGDADSIYRLAVHLQKKNLHHAAIDEFTRILRIDPSYINSYNGIGISYDRQGDFTLAARAYQNAITLNPDLDYLYNNLGYSCLLSGDTDAAIKAFEKAIRIAPHNRRYHNNLALAFAEKGLFESAYSEFILAGDEFRARANMAQILSAKGLYDKAGRYISELSAISSYGSPADETIRVGDTATSSPEATIASALPAMPGADTTTEKPYEAIQDDVDMYFDPPSNEPRQIIRTPFYPGSADNASFAKQDETTHSAMKTSFSENNPETFTHSATIPASGSSSSIIVPDPRHYLPGIEIEVSNGNGVNRMATKVGNYLRSKGFTVTSITNADHFDHNDTLIYYQADHLRNAYEVAKQIPGYQNMEKITVFRKPNVRIKVLIGKDLTAYSYLLPRG